MILKHISLEEYPRPMSEASKKDEKGGYHSPVTFRNLHKMSKICIGILGIAKANLAITVQDRGNYHTKLLQDFGGSKEYFTRASSYPLPC